MGEMENEGFYERSKQDLLWKSLSRNLIQYRLKLEVNSIYQN